MMCVVRLLTVVVFALAGVSSFAQSCQKTTDLGSMGPPGAALIGNSFNSIGSYRDCYTFDVSSSAASFGVTLNSYGIDLQSVALYSGGIQLALDNSPLTYSFAALAQGVNYTLSIASEVFKDMPVAYAGIFTTYAAPVPEPATYGMFALGLLGVAAAVRRKSR